MRVRLPLRRTVFFVGAFLFCLVALLPLRFAIDWMALDGKGLAAREAQGSIWLGGLREAQFGTVPLGDLQAQMRSLPLLLGEARIDMRRPNQADGFKGSVTITRHSFRLDDIEARLQTASLLAPLPITGLTLDDLTVRFVDGRCAGADGLVRAAVAGDLRGMPLTGGLSGKARCDAGALLLPMVGQSGMEALNLRLFQDGRYSFELAVRAADPALMEILLAEGFAASAGGTYAMRREGRF